ncbi:T9SS type B sorting domain-containing protein [Adhaeribacter soli]|uniref:Gliding motility-associated C-terminal domain-containing protein n=1 Tax=Adhaeribacter soli TaxID=2607655 RepID=A0A5N1J1M3_9BACT|nr:gliding motility-associated C-terminal domain-containing protein [Adhaeribacter soli]KAA9340298.1 gliding motility-associated C-terminal domain-containing protein [Adhaeribacter soli]
MSRFLSLFLIAFMLFAPSDAFSQNKEGANWLFGGNIHLDFNRAKPRIDAFSFMAVDSMLKGVAAISDKNGELLFFTSKGHAVSRQKVNGIYQAMPNGAFHTGPFPKSTLAEMIMQSPADSNLYYLFFVGYQFVNNISHQNLYYLQIDMRLNNGNGDVVPNSLQLLKKEVAHFKLTALLHSNNRDTWVGCTNYAGDSILAYLVTPGGIMPPVVSKPSNRFSPFSRMKASPNSEMFAVGNILGSGIEGMDIYDFNRATGTASLKYSLTPPVVGYPLFSFAFSPDNSRLYAGTIGYAGFPNDATVFQFDLAAGNNAQVQQSRNVIYNTTRSDGVFDMQLAIDGKIYLVIDSTYLSQINCPDFYGAACRFQTQGIKLPGRVNGGSLPTLNQTIFRNAGKLQAQAYRNLICEGDSVPLSAYGAGAEQFRWKPANGLTSPADTSANPVVNPTETTTYMVIGSSVCRTDTAYVKVTVLPKPKPLSISGPLHVYTYAEKQVYSVKDPVPGNKFDWQVSGGSIGKGQGSSRIEVNWGANGTGTITVTESNAAGCKWGSASLEVEISGEPDLIIYNIITPNDDGKNDAFVIENLKWYPQNELRLFNRWGMQVYQSKNYLNNWKAGNVSAGIYYYLFTANGKAWKGWVEVVK